MSVTVKITGIAEVDKMFRRLNVAMQKKIIRRACREGAKVVLPAAKAAAPFKTGALRKSLKVLAKKRSRSRDATFGVNVITKEGLFRGETFYGAFLEFGTKRIKARHFLEAAGNQKEQAVIQAARNAIVRDVTAEAK